MNHQDWLAGQLKDDAFAAQYLTQAAQNLEPAVFTAALRHVIDARCGIAATVHAGAKTPPAFTSLKRGLAV